MMTGTLVLPDVRVGMMLQSTTRRPSSAVHAQFVVDYRQRIGGVAHLARAARMEDRSAGVPGEFQQIRIGLQPPGPAGIRA